MCGELPHVSRTKKKKNTSKINSSSVIYGSHHTEAMSTWTLLVCVNARLASFASSPPPVSISCQS